MNLSQPIAEHVQVVERLLFNKFSCDELTVVVSWASGRKQRPRFGFIAHGKNRKEALWNASTEAYDDGSEYLDWLIGVCGEG